MERARVWSLAVCPAPCAGEMSGQPLEFHCHFDVACDEETTRDKTGTDTVVDVQDRRVRGKGETSPIGLLEDESGACRIGARTGKRRFDPGCDPDDPRLNQPAVLTVSRFGPQEAGTGVPGGYFGTCEVN